MSGGGHINNLGTIAGGAGGSGISGASAGIAGVGIVLSGGGTVANGSAGDGAAAIAGGVGIQFSGATTATVTNYGTIASLSGTSGTAVSFANSSSLLVVEGGSTLVGTAVGGGGTLDFAADGGVGTASGLGSHYV